MEAMKASTPVTERLALGQELPTRVHGGLSMLRRCSTPAFRETQRQESAGGWIHNQKLVWSHSPSLVASL